MISRGCARTLEIVPSAGMEGKCPECFFKSLFSCLLIGFPRIGKKEIALAYNSLIITFKKRCQWCLRTACINISVIGPAITGLKKENRSHLVTQLDFYGPT